MRVFLVLLLAAVAACADEGDGRFLNVRVDSRADIVPGARIQNIRVGTTDLQQMVWCLSPGGACDPSVNGGWTWGTDSVNRMVLQAGQGAPDVLDVFHVTTSGNAAIPGTFAAAGGTFSGTVSVGNHLNVGGVTVINLTQDLLNIHSYTSDTGNVSIASDVLSLNRASGSVQQIRWLVGGSDSVAGAYAIGGDASGNFTLISGSLLADVFHVTSSGNGQFLGRMTSTGATVSGSVFLTGLTTGAALDPVCINPTTHQLYENGCGSSLTSPPVFDRAAYNISQQIGWTVGGSNVVNGAYALGPDGLGNFALYSGTSGTPADIFHVTPSGSAAIPGTFAAAGGTFSGTVSVGNHLVVNGQTVISSTQDLQHIHSYTSDTGNLTITGDALQMSRATSGTIQQISWQVAGSSSAAGGYALGSDSSGNFTLISGTAGSSDVFHITGNGNGQFLGRMTSTGATISSSVFLTGLTPGSALDTVCIDPTTHKLFEGGCGAAGTGSVDITGVATIEPGAAIQLLRTTSTTLGPQIQWCIAGGSCDPSVTGGWTIGPDTTNKIVIQAGSGGGTLTDIFHLDVNGNLTTATSMQSGNGTFSGTLTVNNHAVFGTSISATQAVLARSVGVFTNSTDASPGVFLLNAPDSQTCNDYVHPVSIFPGYHREAAGITCAFVPSSSTDYEVNGLQSTVVSDSTTSNVVAGSFFAIAKRAGSRVWPLNTLVRDYINENPATHVPATLIGNEMDMSVADTGTNAAGINMNIQWLNGKPTPISVGLNIQQAGASGPSQAYFDVGIGFSDYATGKAMTVGLRGGSSTGESSHIQFIPGNGSRYFSDFWADSLGGFVFAPDAVHNANSVTIDHVGNLVLAGGSTSGSLQMSRATAGTIQQISWQVAGSTSAAGGYALGSDSSGNFTLISGTAGSSDVFHITGNGNGQFLGRMTSTGATVSGSVFLTGLTGGSGLDAVCIDPSTKKLFETGCGGSGSSYTVASNTAYFSRLGIGTTVPYSQFEAAYNGALDWGVVGVFRQNSASTPDGAMIGISKSMSTSFVTYAFGSTGAGTVHSITVNGTSYTYTEAAGDTAAVIAAQLQAAVNNSHNAYATAALNATAGQIILNPVANTGAFITVFASDGNSTATLVQNQVGKDWGIGIMEGANVGTFAIVENLGYSGGFGSKRLVILPGGNVGIGLTSPLYALDVSGFINASSGFKVAGATFVDSSGNMTALSLSSTNAIVSGGDIRTSGGYLSCVSSCPGFKLGATVVIDNALNFTGANASFSGTLTAGTFSPASISTGALSASNGTFSGSVSSAGLTSSAGASISGANLSIASGLILLRTNGTIKATLGSGSGGNAVCIDSSNNLYKAAGTTCP